VSLLLSQSDVNGSFTPNLKDRQVEPEASACLSFRFGVWGSKGTLAPFSSNAFGASKSIGPAREAQSEQRNKINK